MIYTLLYFSCLVSISKIKIHFDIHYNSYSTIYSYGVIWGVNPICYLSQCELFKVGRESLSNLDLTINLILPLQITCLNGNKAKLGSFLFVKCTTIKRNKALFEQPVMAFYDEIGLLFLYQWSEVLLVFLLLTTCLLVCYSNREYNNETRSK